jgi:SsrA-binding protein
MAKKASSGSSSPIIVSNKKARHDYFIEDRIEAGIALEGWEVKSLRDGRAQLRDSYVQFREGEAWLTGVHISPLATASTHITPDPLRPRKLLLHRREIDHLAGSVERRGYTVVPLELRWSKGRAKVMIGRARGKQQHDKRATARERDWQREKQRLLRPR